MLNPAPVVSRAALPVLAVVLGVLALSGLAALSPARAQVALVVNGAPITTGDIDQRQRLEQMTGQPQFSREQAVQALIEDRLKLQEARRFGLNVSEDEMNNQIATIAARNRWTLEQFEQFLGQRGVRLSTFRDRLRAEVAWNALVRGRFQSAATTVRDIDVYNVVRQRGGTAGVTYDYVLRQFVFTVARDADPARLNARRAEAEAFRARFQGCEPGVTAARALRDVAVLDTVRRNSADLSQVQREALEKTQVGKLTAPERGALGFEMIAVCERTEVAGGATGQREVRAQLEGQRLDAEGRRYLNEVRSRAVIERR